MWGEIGSLQQRKARLVEVFEDGMQLVDEDVELFTWFIILERLNIMDRLCKLKMLSNNEVSCVLCSTSKKSVHHIFFGCEWSWGIWSTILKRWNLTQLSLPFQGANAHGSENRTGPVGRTGSTGNRQCKQSGPSLITARRKIVEPAENWPVGPNQ
ncbi:hypothetical protein Ahy_B05g076275 [Arachis hypogaea]|uniref:Reverse transcriptase zinc-binding domain-containing protein n=1 Tax=Arachis hypogaea TaxID=3818 RepID=A0A444Z2W1_ARAHY|nr:hypothetical protein Ahy_B05g076275 [Arachis hypogaea]